MRYPPGSERAKRHVKEVQRWRKKNPEKVRAYNRLYASRNRLKLRAKSRRIYRARPEIWLRSDLKKRYNMSLEDFNSLLGAQNGLCAICGHPETSRYRRLSVDHDHNTGKIRGLLCSGCNSGLGRFKDDPARVERALLYLTKHQMRGKDAAPTNNPEG